MAGQDNNFSDVTLACEDGQQIKAHKVILAGQSQSAVFKLLTFVHTCLSLFQPVDSSFMLSIAVSSLQFVVLAVLSFQCLLQASIYGCLKLPISVSVC